MCRSKRILSVLLPLALLVLVGAEHKDKSDTGSKEGKETYQSSEHTQDSGKQAGTFKAKLIDASALIGSKVINDKDEEIGEVKDIVLNEKHDCVAYVAISSGGALSIGDKLYAVPWQALKVKSQARDKIEKVIFAVDRNQLEHNPGFNAEQWPSEGDAQWVALTEAARKDMMSKQQGSGKAHYSSDKDSKTKSEKTSQQAMEHSHDKQVCKLSMLKGMEVHKGNLDHQLAEIHDVILDKREGRPVYFVLEFGGIMDMGDKLAVVPWAAVDFHPDRQVVSLNVTEQMLETLAYEPAQAPDLSELSRAEQIHREFDQQPYWQTFGYTEPSSESSESKSSKTSGEKSDGKDKGDTQSNY